MIRRAFLKRMAFAALASGFFSELHLEPHSELTGLTALMESTLVTTLHGISKATYPMWQPGVEGSLPRDMVFPVRISERRP